MNDPVDRRQDSILAGYERRLLVAIARRLPRWLGPDGLTAIGVLGAVLTLAGYLLSNLATPWIWLASFGLVVHWLGDSLDGTLARVRRIERPSYGFYLDQNVDVIGNLLIAIGAGLSPWLRMDVALLVLAGYHMLSIHTLVTSVVTRRMQIDVRGLGPTEMRLTIIAMNLIIATAGGDEHVIWGHAGTIWDALAVGLALALGCLFVVELACGAIRLRRADDDKTEASR